MMYRFRAGDVVVAIETTQSPGPLFGPQGRTIPNGKACAHRCVVKGWTRREEAFWKGPCYRIESLARFTQLPEAALMTEAQFEQKCRENGIEPVYATDLIATLEADGLTRAEIQADYRKQPIRR